MAGDDRFQQLVQIRVKPEKQGLRITDLNLILRRNVVDTVYWEPLPASAVVSRRVFLGSSSGLRGYGSGQFEGDNL